MTQVDLPLAIRELTGATTATTAAPQLGPGITYLLALPGREIRYFQKAPEAFPNSFYQLADSAATWDELVEPSDQKAYLATFEAEAAGHLASYRICINKRGNNLPVNDYRHPLYNDQGELVGILGRLIDDSFRKAAIDSMSRRCWKEIATCMTRRFLHDFNNTIAGIYSLSELYAEPGSDPRSMVEAMGHIRDCSIRAQDITRRIRHLTSLEEAQSSYFDLRTLAREQEEYLQALLPKGATIDYHIEEEEEMPVRLDANQFRQAMLHLASNSFDAAGNDVSIAVRVRRHPTGSALFAAVEFQDNGPGFNESELARATEPFFSTKDEEKHPGLGLCIVKTFAESLGGSLEVANCKNGAVVRILFPIPNLGPKSKSASTSKAKQTVAALEAPAAGDTAPDEGAPAILVYTWEDITRHPLLVAMKKAGWSLRVHLDAGELLVDLSQSGSQLDGVLVFKSALDEKAEPLLCELGHAKNCRKIAVLALGESIEALSDSLKRNCGFIAPGASKPTALLNKLAKYYR